MIYRFFKYFSDFLISLISLIFLLPLFLIIAIIIKLSSKGHVFFKQKRVGKNKKLFTILKFRTMRVDTPKNMPTHLLEDANSYITKIGRFLRKTSLDELPQLINILFGQMSIIGPRPALWNQDDLIIERDKYNANKLRPGLTGWAQINGRDELPIDKKAELDGYYVNHIGLFLDIKIFFKTIFKIFKSEGVVEGSQKKEEQESQWEYF